MWVTPVVGAIVLGFVCGLWAMFLVGLVAIALDWSTAVAGSIESVTFLAVWGLVGYWYFSRGGKAPAPKNTVPPEEWGRRDEQ